MKTIQLTLFMKVCISILTLCFLLGTSYIALKISSIPIGSLLDGNRRLLPVRKDFIQVLIRTEEDSVAGAVSLVNSIISNSESPVHFYFITDPKSSKELHSWIETSLHHIYYIIKLVEPPGEYNATISKTVPSENWLDYTLVHIPKLFPQIKDRLIVLSDDIIVQGDIAKLNNATIMKNHFGALSTNCDTVSRIFDKNQNRYYHYFNLNNPSFNNMNIDGKQCIFNMGVMVLNMTLWIEKDVTHELNSWLIRNEKEKLFHMNPALSSFLLVFYNKTTPLDTSWHVRHLGVTSGSRYSKDYLKKANLLHWDGHFKPWKQRSSHVELWQKYFIPKTA